MMPEGIRCLSFISSKTPSFTWNPVEFAEDIPVYYRLEIWEDLAGESKPDHSLHEIKGARTRPATYPDKSYTLRFHKMLHD